MKIKIKLKVGICIAYDWEMLKTALPLFYNDVDSICLSLDINRNTWAGNRFDFDASAFYNYVKEIDNQSKIIIYEDDFYQDKQHPMKNEVYQRNQIAKKLGIDNSWFLQLDVDEYFLDFKSVARFLRENTFSKDVNICLPFITLFKKLDSSYLAIKGETEWMPFITNKPHYEYGRINGYFNYKLDLPVLHQSWAREESEIQQKISNWGHKNDFDVESFLKKWQSLDIHNYVNLIDFHPINGKSWHELVPIEGSSINELIQNNKSSFEDLKTYSPLKIKFQNSRLFSKFMQIFNFRW